MFNNTKSNFDVANLCVFLNQFRWFSKLYKSSIFQLECQHCPLMSRPYYNQYSMDNFAGGARIMFSAWHVTMLLILISCKTQHWWLIQNKSRTMENETQTNIWFHELSQFILIWYDKWKTNNENKINSFANCYHSKCDNFPNLTKLRCQAKDPPVSLKDPRQQSTKVEKSKAEHTNFIENKKISKSIHKPKSYSKFCKYKN